MSHIYKLEIDESLFPCPAVLALIWAEDIRQPEASSQPPAFLAQALSAAQDKGEDAVSIEVRQRVRKMLRHGKYKPSGRSKPASEFLLQAALGETFPLVNPPVDVNNAISLESGFPGSIFDTDLSGNHMLLRRGLSGEAYVFNPSGQLIDLQDLLLVCRESSDGWEPCGNPVKDAMITKISASTQNVIAVLYAPIDEPRPSLDAWAGRYATLLREHCGASAAGYKIVVPDGSAGPDYESVL